MATFVAITLVSKRNSAEESAEPMLPSQVIVDDLLISLETDPEKAIFLPEEINHSDTVEIQVEVQEIEDDQESEYQLEQAQPPALAPDPVIYANFTVQRGDTLYSIARYHDTTIELMALHGISGDDMFAGNVLNLPVANPAYCPGMQAYVVRENDTLYSIARATGTTPEDLAAANNIGMGTIIYTTNVLCTP
jgi:LysM repeat protein